MRTRHHPVSSSTATAYRRAFTLVEVLAASLLSAVLAGAFCAALASAVSLRERAEALLDARRPTDRIAAIIRNDLENALPPGDALVGDFVGENTGGFGSERSTLEFYTASGMLSEDEPWPRVQRIYYCIDKDANTGKEALFRSVTRNLLALTEEDPEDQVLLGDVDSLSIEYYDGDAWQDTWDSADEEETPLPEAVLFVVTPAESEEGYRKPEVRLYVPIVVEPRPEAEETSEGEGEAAASEGGETPPDSGDAPAPEGGDPR